MSNVPLLKLTKLGLGLAILTPLVSSSRFVFPYILPRVLYFRTVVAVTAFVYLLAVKSGQAKKPRFHAPVVAALLVFLGAQTAAAVFGVNPYQSFTSTLLRSDGVITLAHAVLLSMIASAVLYRARDWQPFLRGLVAILAVEVIFGLGQAFGWSAIPRYGYDRPTGATGNPAFFALLLVFGVWLPLLTLAIERRLLSPSAPKLRIVTLAYPLISFGSLLALWQTQIRGSTFALLLVMALLLLAYGVRGSSLFWRRGARVGLAVFAGTVLVVLLGRGSALVKWNPTLERLSQTGVTAITVENRLIAWGAGLQGFLARPLLGWGPENFGVTFDRFFNPKISRDFGSFSWYDRAHNEAVEIAVGSGGIGLAAYFFVIAAVVLALHRMAKNPAGRRTAFVSGALLATYFLSTLTAFGTINSTIFLFFTLALVVSAATPEFWQPVPSPLKFRNVETSKSRNTNQLPVGPMVAAGIATAIAVISINILPGAAAVAASRVALKPNRDLRLVARDFARAFRRTPPQRHEYRQQLGNLLLAKIAEGPLPASANFDPLLNLGIEQLQQSVAVDPNNLQTQLILSELARQLATTNPALLPVAERAAAEVLKRSPERYHGYFAVGRVAMTAGRNQDGINAFQQAAVRYPHLPAVHWNLAIAYILDGRVADAERAVAQARRIDEPNFWQPESVDKLGRAFADRGYLEQAANLYREALERSPNNAEYYRRLAKLAAQLKDTVEAQAAARAAVGLDPNLAPEFAGILSAKSP